MSQNICHKIANESLFVGFAVSLLTIIATVAYSMVWPAIVLLFSLRAAYDFSNCTFKIKDSSRKITQSLTLQPLKA